MRTANTEIIVATEEHFEDLVAMVTAFRDMLKRTTPVGADTQKSLTMLFTQENREFFVARDEAGHSLGYIKQRDEYSMWLSGNEARLENPEYPSPGYSGTVRVRHRNGRLQNVAA